MAINELELNDKKYVPRRVVFVLDQSGSMKGSKWIQAQKSVVEAITQLNHDIDLFNVIVFSNWNILLEDKIAFIKVNKNNIQNAINFIKTVDYWGSTNINEALIGAADLFIEEMNGYKTRTKNYIALFF